MFFIAEAHRALELLEDYHSRLSAPQDRALRIAIERVIRIFKSRLFQALLGKWKFKYQKYMNVRANYLKVCMNIFVLMLQPLTIHRMVYTTVSLVILNNFYVKLIVSIFCFCFVSLELYSTATN